MKLFTHIALVLFLFFISGYSVSGQTASFTEDYISGCSPLVVHFTNTSTGATSYSWNLGNGTPLTGLTNPSTSYSSVGTYTVTLTASNGSSASVATVIITVYPTPTVSFTANDTAVCPGVAITFTSTSSSGVAGPVTYQWNFGDGTSSTAASPTHTFPGPGYYNITLSVTNSQGCVSSLTKVAYIHVFTPSVPGFTASPTYVCKSPGTVVFTNTSSGTGPYSCTWSFGDGTTGTGTSPSHTYTASGTYTVKLVETDGDGCTDSLTIPAYIVVGSITAAFTWPATACVNSSVTFTNTGSGYTSSSWNFGDGGTSSVGTHTYTTAGTYTVTLIVSNGSCHDTITHTITILPAAIASFTISPAAACPAPVTATFTGTVPAGSSVTWMFGDGATGSGTTTTHTYSSCGADTVKMIVTNSSGCIDTITHVYDIYNLIIKINHDSIPSGCVPLTVLFRCYIWTTCPVAGAYPYSISSYQWNFGDGSPIVSGGVSISHTYTTPGTYTCTVNIVTANGCTAMAVLPVLVGIHPVASFTATPTTVCYGHPVVFTNTSTGATNYLWLFGDGSTSTTTNPTYTYPLPGVYTDTLIAYNNGCPDTMIRVNYITVDSPKAIINATYACTPANEVIFGDSSLGDNSHLWIFGDGTTSTLNNPTHIFPALTTYTVTLTTYNSASGCRDTTTLLINLIHPTITFTASSTAICKYGSVVFTPTVTGDSAVSYSWYDNGGFIGTGMVFTHTFNVTGLHTIMLIITDIHGCTDTFTRNNYILVAKPAANFTESPTSGCVNLAVNFTDHTTDVAGTTLTGFAWAFGDGVSTSITTTTTAHTYIVPGTFNVTEIVTDNYGCTDTATGVINTYQPVGTFYAVPTYPCAGNTVNFINTSSGIVSSSWMFGDGGTSVLASPTHIYTAAGNYSVTLIVTDSHGCPDTVTLVNYIHVTKPVAAFAESDTFSICAPLSEVFTNLSTGATSYHWTFGDGSSSINFNASDLYITPGNYIVTLIVTNAYGCKDTAIHHVNIYGYAGAFTYTPDTGCAPLTVYFSATLSNVPSITWDFGDGSTASTPTGTTGHTYTIPGGYLPKLILSDNTGCQNSSIGIDTIKVDAVTVAFTTGPACLNETVNFINNSTSYWSTVTSYLWSFSGGATSTIVNPTYLYNAVGTYSVTLTATDAWGCTATKTGDVVIHPLPVITASADTTICVGDTATLYGYGGVTYIWSPPGTLGCTACNPTHVGPVVITTYTVAGTDMYGCIGTDTVTVFMRTKTTSIAYGDTAVCKGTPVTLHDSGATYFTWLPNTGLNNNHIADPTANPQGTTTYTVIAQLGRCTPDTNYVTISIYPLPTVDAGPDQTLLAGSIAQLQATGTYIITYTWSPATTLSCVNCSNPVASMSVTTTYTVEVATWHDCKSSDSVTIHLFCNTSQVFIPNTFTPNGNGENDVFYPRGTGVDLIKSFRIYNRWGELLFERSNIQINDASNAWNGSYGNMPPRPDVYVYVIDAICETGEPIFLKGSVTIIR
ncbi:MAG: PKD domain-containing protein [Chitinophagales bacterium]